jgi:excisionase family DNA binding protein
VRGLQQDDDVNERKDITMNAITEKESLSIGLERTIGAYSIPTFCHLFSIGRTLTYAEIKAGRLKIAKIGRRTLIPAEAAMAWLNQHQTQV